KLRAECFGDYPLAHVRFAMPTIPEAPAGTTAVFAGSDKILIGMLEVLRERKLGVGDDLSVITFDDAEPLSLLDPPITAVRQPITEMGRVAIGLALKTPGDTLTSEAIRLPVELIVRDSVKAPRPAGSRSRAGRRYGQLR